LTTSHRMASQCRSNMLCGVQHSVQPSMQVVSFADLSGTPQCNIILSAWPASAGPACSARGQQGVAKQAECQLGRPERHTTQLKNKHASCQQVQLLRPSLL
jgi:hypothetical protein